MIKKIKDKVLPEGDKCSFDTENREKFPKDQKEPPIQEYKSKTRDEYIDEAIKYVEKNFSKHYGECNTYIIIFNIIHQNQTWEKTKSISIFLSIYFTLLCHN